MLSELETIETNLELNLYGKQTRLINQFSSNDNLLRNKKSNKKIKIKTLLKTDGISSYLKQRLCDCNGNLIEDEAKYDCLKYTMLKRNGKSFLSKGKSKLHVKYDVYNKFQLSNLEKSCVKPLEKCSYIYSNAYLLKQPKPIKTTNSRLLLNSEIPKPVNTITSLPPPPLQVGPIPVPVPEVFTIPAYMYKLDKAFLVVPNYSYLILNNEFYCKFMSKTSTTKISEQESSLPLIIMEQIISSDHEDVDLISSLVEENITRDLLVLLSLLTSQKNNFHSDITKADMITLPEVPKTSNYYSKGVGFGTGDTRSIWSITLTLWKLKTEKAHILLILKIFDSLLKAVITNSNKLKVLKDQILDSCLSSCTLTFIANSSIMDIADAYDLYEVTLNILLKLSNFPIFIQRLDQYSDSIKSLINISKAYLLKIKDERLSLFLDKLNKLALSFDKNGAKTRGKKVEKVDNEIIYCNQMKDYLFDTYKMIDENSDGVLQALIPYSFFNSIINSNSGFNRSKRIAQEMITLSTSLPLSSSSSIFVRCDEERIDVMKALIVGPFETPYSIGCFEFDIFFPMNYPQEPPKVILKTTGNGTVRFNPNLYNCGKVCLSVLNTWNARPEEKWNSETSTLLQVLVSIQSLILVPDPYFNEPGYQHQYKTPGGEMASERYNVTIMEATMKWAIIEMIKAPPECFKDAIYNHFLLKANELKIQCEAWHKKLRSYYLKNSNEIEIKKFEGLLVELQNEIKGMTHKKS